MYDKHVATRRIPATPNLKETHARMERELSRERRRFPEPAHISAAIAARRKEYTPSNTPKSRTLTNLSLAGGIAATPVSMIPIGFAVASAPHFNFDVNTISSLLPHDDYLRAGLAATGVLGAGFSYGLKQSLPDSFAFGVESGMFTVSSAAVSVAAIFPPPSEIHYPAAGTYFIGASLTMATLGGNLIARGSRVAGSLTVAASAASMATIGYGFFQASGVPAKYELIASAVNAVWMLGTAAYALVKNKLAR